MPAVTRPSVFVGPRPFRTGEPLFGRDREVTDLTNLLLAERVVLLYSPSGAGKTSLVQAGLIPRLRPDSTPGRKPRPRVFDVPIVHESIDQRQPGVAIRVNGPLPADVPAGTNRYVFSALTSLEARKPATGQFAPNDLAGFTLSEYLAREFPVPPSGSGGTHLPPFLVFDQFEEVLTQDPTDTAAKRAFFEQLGEALADRGRWALLAVREDHLAEFDPYVTLLPNRLDVRYRLGRLTHSAALDAILKPTEGTDLRFDRAFADDLVKNLRQVRVQQGDDYVTATGPDVEPVYLQVVCKRLWEMPDEDRAEAGVITGRDFDRLTAEGRARTGTGDGGLTGVDAILAGYYAEAVARSAGEVSERRLRDWFERELITRARTRKPVPSTEHPWKDLPRDRQRLSVLDQAYLIREDSRGGTRWLELAHDRLIEPVLRDNDRWRAANLTPFQRAAGAWAESKARPDEMLVAGEVLAWGEAHPGELTDDEQAFLKASRAAADRQGARTRMWLSWGAAGVLLALLIVAGVIVSQFRARLRAQEAARVQESATVQFQKELLLAQYREKTRRGDQAKRQAELGVIGNWDWKPEPNGRSSPPVVAKKVGELVKLLQGDGAGNDFPEGEAALRHALQRLGWRGLAKFDGPVHAVAFSPSGRWLAAGGGRDTILVPNSPGLKLWDLRDGRMLPRAQEQKVVPGAFAYSADEEFLWFAAMRGNVYRWRLDSRTFKLNGVQISGVDIFRQVQALFLPLCKDGQWVVAVSSGSSGGEARWQPTGDGPPVVHPLDKPRDGDTVSTTAVGCDPMSCWCYTGTNDGRVFGWNLSGQCPIVTELNQRAKSAVTTLAVHPRGANLVVGTLKGPADLWELESPVRVKKSYSLQWAASASALRFHPSGDWLAASSPGRSVLFHLGALEPGKWDRWFMDQRAVSTFAFDPPADKGPPAPGQSVPGPLLLSGFPDGVVELLSPKFGQEYSNLPFRLPGPNSAATASAISPDRSRAVVGCIDGTVHLWDLRRITGWADAEPYVLPSLGGIYDEMAASLDGRWLATADDRGTVLVWNLTGPTPVVARQLQGPQLDAARTWRQLRLVGSSLTYLTDLDPPTSWDLSRLDDRPIGKGVPFPVTDLARAVITPDCRWVVGFEPPTGQPPTLLVSPLDRSRVERYPIPVAPTVSPEELLLAVGGAPPRTGGEETFTLVAAVGGEIVVWRFDSAVGFPYGPTQLPLNSTPTPVPTQVAPGVRRDGFVALAVSPDGQRIVAATQSGNVRVWEVRADRQVRLLQMTVLPAGQVTALAFSPDGTRFAVGGNDGIVRLYEAGSNYNPITLPVQPGWVNSLLFVRSPPLSDAPNRPGDLRLVTINGKGAIRVWTVEREALLKRALMLAQQAENEH